MGGYSGVGLRKRQVQGETLRGFVEMKGVSVPGAAKGSGATIDLLALSSFVSISIYYKEIMSWICGLFEKV